MTNDPGDRQDDSNNPFKGTPFEQIFAAFGGGTPGEVPGGGMQGMPDLSMLMSQMQNMMAPYEGPVNWNLAKDVARKTVAQQADPSPGDQDGTRVADALRLADHWLDLATDFPSGIKGSAAWSRAQWIEETVEVWRRLVEPVAEHVVGAMGNALPEEARTMAGPLMGMLGKAGGAMFGTQVGQALGGLAGEVLTASDIGLPLGPAGKAALIPENVRAFALGLDVTEEDVFLYLALREAAHHRLFSHVPWLNAHLLAAVEDYGRGTTIDVSKIESKLSEIDPMNPASLQDALEGGLFEPEKTAAQKAALTRLETTLALVEGWVDEVVGQATETRMPAAAKMQEAVRRRRAAGGPAESTFAALVGLELRPRRLRDASALWGSLRSREGHQARDAVWAHPDLLPTPGDLDDPLGFKEHSEEPEALTDAEFDAALTELLDTDTDSGTGTDSGEDGEAGGGDDPPRDSDR
ncbi:MAG: zinc-dependent metalloprotease [Actinomycetota bacterium]|nr:zinc-dependent metalloprotease [Actinomycetota bacterium]